MFGVGDRKKTARLQPTYNRSVVENEIDEIQIGALNAPFF